jgi:hypothetical protein
LIVGHIVGCEVAGSQFHPMRLQVERRAQLFEFGPQHVPFTLERDHNLVGEGRVRLQRPGQLVAVVFSRFSRNAFPFRCPIHFLDSLDQRRLNRRDRCRHLFGLPVRYQVARPRSCGFARFRSGCAGFGIDGCARQHDHSRAAITASR